MEKIVIGWVVGRGMSCKRISLNKATLHKKALLKPLINRRINSSRHKKIMISGRK